MRFGWTVFYAVPSQTRLRDEGAVGVAEVSAVEVTGVR